MEETIPLTRRGEENEDEVEITRQRKGKDRLREPELEPEREPAGSPIFNVGDSEDEEEYKRIVSGR